MTEADQGQPAMPPERPLQRMVTPLDVLSLGAGVQSSCVAAMSDAGELPPLHAAIFADTGDEPGPVMAWLDYLAPKLSFPVYRVSAGVLSEDFLNALKSGGNSRCGQPPYFIKGKRDILGMEGKLWRKCTKEYKLTVIRREVRRLLRQAGKRTARQWIGISLDEAHRMKDSGVRYIKNHYPLVERRMNRHDCLRWLSAHGWPTPPKSACWHCPFTDDDRWRWLRDNSPQDWQKAKAYDAELRALKPRRAPAGIKGEIYIHRSCRPLSEVDLSTEEDHGQMNLWGEECDGLCGV